MSSRITVERLVAVLKKVPEKTFSIAELAPMLLNEKGEVDIVKAIDKQADLNLAIIEVESYVRATREAIQALNGIGRRVEDNDELPDDQDNYIDEEFE